MADNNTPLAEYNRKRDFARTAEPAGKIARTVKGKPLKFIVQKHDATRLHWDFRLEIEGVLKSWAVTKGPSADPQDKRLAVRTEDHPMSYADFEGTIPKGEYGGGTVMLWDEGTWEPIAGKDASTLEEGHLHFILHGKRMRGEWLLVRMKPRGKEKRENWLLRKIEDEHAKSGDTLVQRELASVSTGRSMASIASQDNGRTKWNRVARKGAAKLPEFRKPMLATLSTVMPSGENWLFEIKYDGYRCLLGVGGGTAKAWTRSGLDWSDKYPGIIQAAGQFDVGSALIDGEIVALDGNGRPSFSALQAALKNDPKDLHLFAFDLLELNGENLTKLPLVERKARLKQILPQDSDILHFSDHIDGDGSELMRTMASNGYEGVVAKRADGLYTGQRSDSWLKIKTQSREEFVIVGWIPSDKPGRYFSSLLLAQHEDGALVYKGRVGTGFNDATQQLLHSRFARLKQTKPPITNPNKAEGRPVWLKPELVAEIRFAEYTAENVVRQASFIGLREDKPAAEVQPEALQRSPPNSELPVKISNADRRIFGASGKTKGELADYYYRMADHILPWLSNRPLSLVRCPQGIKAKCFFQKHLTVGWGKHVDSAMIKEGDGTAEPLFIVNSTEALLECVQMGTIEFHGWGARADAIECPDRLVFDLDPDEKLDFDDVKRAARDIHDHLAEMGLVTYAMLSGGKGVHVIAPLKASTDWDAVKDFAERFARALEGSEPDRFTANMSKARRKGRIFIDWLRNQRGSTSIMPWSVRARQSAGVAVPVNWSQLDALEIADAFSINRTGDIVNQLEALEPGWGVAQQGLPDL
jgi:bifunctional non-homologous end joining protein LigD